MGVGVRDLEPVHGTFGGFVGRSFSREHFHHKTFTGIFDCFFEEGLNFFNGCCVHVFCECEFAFDFCEIVA